MSKQPPPAPTVSAVGPCPTVIQTSRTPRHWKFTQHHRTTRPPPAPMERVHIDFLGPLPKTPRGNENIFIMVDQFTKWVECIPLPSQTAEVTAKAAVDHFFSRFGYRFHIFSDQRRNFESKLFAALCNALQIHKSRCWLVGCFGFNGPLRQYFSLYRAVSQREGERGEKG